MGKTAEAAQLTKHQMMESDNGEYRRIPKADQCFLAYFIMGVYFGPDLKDQKPQKSALQRIIEELPPYTCDHLGGSSLRIEELEQIYCFLLRKFDESIEIDLSVFRKFLRGLNPKQDSTKYLQFPDLFPARLHQFSESADGRSVIIENIVYIHRPEISYLRPDDVARFKKVTGQEDFSIQRCSTKLIDIQNDLELQRPTQDIRYYRRKRRLDGDVCSNGTPNTPMLALPPSGGKWKPEPLDGPAVVVLPSQPSNEELDEIVARSRYGYALRGSAVKGQVGPVIGLMDIGEAQDSYLFRVALPGVKKEGRAFRCEVESDGKVLIKGETVTGETTVYRYTQAFEMQTRNLCPPGPFSISFRLPGPVDHRQFMGSFGADGILEGIVKKAGNSAAIG